jgi:hypothetical protein
VVNAKGTHSESYWRKMFPGFYEWLVGGLLVEGLTG